MLRVNAVAYSVRSQAVGLLHHQGPCIVDVIPSSSSEAPVSAAANVEM